jgi:uncharacterized protein YndB with AHSA1/START domain
MNVDAKQAATVRKELVVEVDQRRAFEVFTAEISQWWPLVSHHIGGQTPDAAIIEPFINGRWFERAMDGSECDWGRVIVWDPPRHLVLSWCINTHWQFEATLATEVDVTFTPEGASRTRVVLEHRHLDRYGSDADKMRGIFDSEGGWTGILQSYAARAASRPFNAPACPESRTRTK